jgi:hypothetical protein
MLEAAALPAPYPYFFPQVEDNIGADVGNDPSGDSSSAITNSQGPVAINKGDQPSSKGFRQELERTVPV